MCSNYENIESDFKDTPLKHGYERIYAPCGAYRDRPIINFGEERCDGCEHSFSPETLETDGATSNIQHVCNDCLQNGNIIRCSTCNNFTYPLASFVKKNEEKRFGNKIYCNSCRPPIVLTFNVQNPKCAIEISVPINHEYGINETFFYEEIAKRLQVSTDRVLINGRKNKHMMYCPIEFVFDSTTFNVDILNNEV